MIEIKRDGKNVALGITSYIPNYESKKIIFCWDAGSELLAGFLSHNLQQTIFNAVKEARKEAYEQGWKDAKSKKAKETWFNGRLG